MPQVLFLAYLLRFYYQIIDHPIGKTKMSIVARGGYSLAGGFLLALAPVALDKAVELFKDSAKGTPPTITPQPPKSLTQREQFLLILAEVLFRIDGEIAPLEQAHLNELRERSNVTKEAEDRLATVQKDRNIFASLRSWYKALSNEERQAIAVDAGKLADIDQKRTAEEEAFLIQLAQIIENQDRLDLFVATQQSNSSLIEHDLFKYMTEQQFSTSFVNSTCKFNVGQIYISNPHESTSLIPFCVEDFELSQDQLFDSIIELLKELGAKSVVISESSEATNDTKLTGEAAAEGGNAITTINVEAAGKQALHNLIRTKAGVEVLFDGSKAGFFDRFRYQKVEAQLLRKFKNNAQCCTIIKTRFGNNKAKYFRHEVRSNEARSIARSINAAAKVDYKLVKATAKAGVAQDESITKSVEKSLTVHFYS